MADKKNTQKLNGCGMDEVNPNANPSHSGARFYEIRVKGQLDSRWSEWLEGLEVKLLENGEMILFGPIVDQAALMGVLNKLNRLNLALISVNELKRTNLGHLADRAGLEDAREPVHRKKEPITGGLK